MVLAPQVSEKIRQRFETLVREGNQLHQAMIRAEDAAHAAHQRGGVNVIGELHVQPAEFHSFRTRVLNLITFVGSGSGQLAPLADDVRHMESKPSHAARLLGIVEGLADDYSHGFLDTVLHQAEAEVAADYLGQAEQLLKEGKPGKHDHVPAAVLLGAVLEKALRTLCARQTPPIPATTPKGAQKTLNPLIDDLKKHGVFNELKAKQLRAWADIRNAAAHGEFDSFNRVDVEHMKSGVGDFLASYM